ncbi:hypothetical protein BDR22DRAFT_825814 [Usnea florida]
MVRKPPKPPTNTKKSTRRILKAHPHIPLSSTKSSSAPQIVLQKSQQTTHIELSPENASVIDWVSLLGLAQSDINRATISNFSSISSAQHNAMATPQSLQSKTPTNIMTSIRGTPLYSHGTSAHPSLTNPNIASTPDHPFLRFKPNPTLRFIPWPHPSSSSSTNPRQSPTPPPNTQPSTLPQPQPQPFDPSTTHWAALRDVAFIHDGHFHLAPHALCALLNYRYGSADPQMQVVTKEQVDAMYAFVVDGRKEGREGLMGLYEGEARKLIKGEMGRDLRRLREGGGGVEGGVWMGGF